MSANSSWDTPSFCRLWRTALPNRIRTSSGLTMRHIWPSPLIRPRTMSIIIAKKRALERPAPMDDPKHEPAEYAALRRMSERLRQMTEQFRLLGPKEEPKERR